MTASNGVGAAAIWNSPWSQLVAPVAVRPAMAVLMVVADAALETGVGGSSAEAVLAKR